MLANFEQVGTGRFDLDRKPKLEPKLDIKYHNLIQGLRTTEASGEIADRKIKLNLLILIQCLLTTSENTPKISKDDLTHQIHPTSQIINQRTLELFRFDLLLLLEQ